MNTIIHPPDATFKRGNTALPPILHDALSIRIQVFVDEQGCSAENEVDDDDARSWHWVVYTEDNPNEDSSRKSGKEKDNKKKAIGTVRLVPPSHPQQHQDEHPGPSGMAGEPYVKITRVAVLPAYRGRGIARHLVETAVEWVVHQQQQQQQQHERATQIYQSGQETINGASGASGANSCTQTQGEAEWNGLILVHAQVDVEGLYARLGFWRDEGMGRWLEEGIEHVGMWRRVSPQSPP